MFDEKSFYNGLNIFLDRAYTPITVFYQMDYSGLEKELENLGYPFSSKLFQLIKEKGISEVDCYKKANLDRRLFSKIRSNVKYRPSKETVCCLILALELKPDEAKELLETAGYCFSSSIKRDLAIFYMIYHDFYDINRVNEILFKLGEEPLGLK